MSNLIEHAQRELSRIGGSEPDEMQKLMNKQLIEMVALSASHGHSGFSSAYATAALGKLLQFEPLTPLTGEPSEWNDVDGGTKQNNRCSHVFMRQNGQAYDIQGRVFREPSGSCFTSGDSRVNIEFPYTPTTEYVDVDENGIEIKVKESRDRQQGFKEAATPLIKWLAENVHPHHTAVVTNSSAELLEGKCTARDDSFIED